MDHENIEAKLVKSSSAESLRMEASVASILKSFRWSPTQSMYYADPSTGKLREIDVVAKQYWYRRVRGQKITSVLYFLAECKSLKGWHLLFSPLKRRWAYDDRVEYWLEWEMSSRPSRLISALTEAGVTADEIAEALQLVRNMPSGAEAFGLDVPPAKHRATAFRETNSEREKEDLEQSVLWRAASAVFGAVDAVRDAFYADHIRDMTFGLHWDSFAREINRPAHIADLMRSALRNTSHLHPVVVVGARLHMLRGHELRAVPWVRLEQREIYGRNRWVDVIDIEQFESYASSVTLNYESQMRAHRRRRDNI